ncbi:MAG: DUF973 family protein [Crenarchaeota archaeon]|nr:DUF973 family protein [Thermoproteota archaeon]
MYSNIEYLVSGLRKLREAAMLYIISYVLVLGFYLCLFYALAFAFTGLLVIALIVLITSVILGLVALFAFLIPSFQDLRDYDPSNFGTSCTLVKIGFIGGFIVLIISIALVFYMISIGISIYSLMHHVIYIHQNLTMRMSSFEMYSTYMGSLMMIVGALEILILASLILLFIGYIGIIIGMFKLKDVTGEDLFMVAGILFIISLFIPLLDFIAWILTFVGAGNAIKRVKEGSFAIYVR